MGFQHDEDIGGGLKTCCLDNSGTYATHVSPSDDEACVGKLFRKDEPCPEGTVSARVVVTGRNTDANPA